MCRRIAELTQEFIYCIFGRYSISSTAMMNVRHLSIQSTDVESDTNTRADVRFLISNEDN